MKSPALRALAVAALGIGVGCGTIDEFEVVVEDSATIDGTYASNTTRGLAFGGDFGSGVDLKTQKTFADMGVDPGDVDGIFVQSVQIVPTSPADTRLDPLIESVTLSVSATGEQELEFASATLPEGTEARVINPTVVQSCNGEDRCNFKPYAVAGQMTLGANVAIRNQPLFSTTLKTTITLLVDVRILGL